MKTHELIGILRRNWIVSLISATVIAAIVFFSAVQFTATDKTTLYFTVQASGTADAGNHYYSAEGAERMAEAISGWVKDPAFREEIIQEASIQYGSQVVVDDFKRKITARKQNRMNVFVTLKMTEQEALQRDAIASATQSIIQNALTALNEGASYPFSLTDERVFHEKQAIPLSWLIFAALLFGLGTFCITPFVKESLMGAVSFSDEIVRQYPIAPRLHINKKLGKHDESFLEQFILTFPSPRLVGVFGDAKEHFSLATRDSIDEERDTPILLVRLGQTTQHDLQNLKAIFGSEVGIIIFER